jgi:twitching motility protein PilU
VSAGSQTFEQALYKLFKAGKISKEEALKNADSASNLSSLIDYTQTSKMKSFDPAQLAAAEQIKPTVTPTSFDSIKLNLDLPADQQ